LVPTFFVEARPLPGDDRLDTTLARLYRASVGTIA
jgi:hypothetical protein